MSVRSSGPSRLLRIAVAVVYSRLSMRNAQEIGGFLQQLRKEEGVSQIVIAQRCGLTQKTWSRLENGIQLLTLDLLNKLVQGLPIRAITLLGLESEVEEIQREQSAAMSLSPETSQRLQPLLEYIQGLEQHRQAPKKEQGES